MLLSASRATLVVGGLLVAQTAAAEPPRCIRAHVQAQELELDGKLRAARDQLVQCTTDAKCPDPIVAECTKLLESTQKSLPSVVFAVVDADGRDLTGISVELDGAVLVETVGAEAVELDPGTHEFVLTNADGVQVRETIVLRKGEQGRVVRVTFPAPDQAETEATPQDAAGLPTTFYVSGAVGVVALASFAYFGLDGMRREDELLDTCAPNCTQAEADARYQQFIIADVSLGVSAIALGLAAYIWATHDPDEQPTVQVGLAPAPDGVRVGTRWVW